MECYILQFIFVVVYFLTVMYPKFLDMNEVGARNYKYTGRSNAAWVCVMKWFTGFCPTVEGYGRFLSSWRAMESSIPFHRPNACEPFLYANPGCVGSPGVFITPGTYFMPNGTSICQMGPVFAEQDRYFTKGPVFATWDPSMPNGTRICRMGPVFAEWDQYLPNGTGI